MLHFILGTAGTGKTTRLANEIRSVVTAGGKAILLVPEQYSFEAERLLIRTLGEKGALEVEVLSFTRLASSIFRRFGGLAGVAVSEAGKYLLMSVALGELTDKLTVYRKAAGNTAFLSTMTEACGELKTAGITPLGLEELAQRCQGSPLGDKLGELALVYSAYQSLLERGYTDPEDDLIRACGLLRSGSNFFGGYSVFVDGFTTFMAGEFALLEYALAQSDHITFAMTADSLHDEAKGIGVFSTVKEAIKRLIRLANKNGVPVAPAVELGEPVRYLHPALAHLSRNLLQPLPPVFPGPVEGAVRVHEARDSYSECEYVAASIAGLVREQGLRYNQIAVVARDLAPYLGAMETMLQRYNIPYFHDGREEAENHPLFSGLLAALDAVRSNFDAQAVVLYAKSPILGLSQEDVAALENYAYCWGVRGAVWQGEFTNNPRGLVEDLDEGDKELLEGINATRQMVIAPLLGLREMLRRPNGRSFAAGIFRFLEEIRATEHLTAYGQGFPQGERESFLDMSAQLWDALMDVLDVFGSVLGGVGLTARRASELFRLALGSVEAGQLPQTLDQVLLGQADRIRPGDMRVVFVVGANEGVFPPQITSAGLFTDAERQEMIEMGAEISASSLGRSVLEKFFAYYALTLPREKLYLSWSRSDLEGGELLPSSLVDAVYALFPGIKPEGLSHLDRVGSEKAAFQVLSELWRGDSVFAATLLEYFSTADKADTLERMRRSSAALPHHITDRQTAKALFGGRMRLSPSRIERYYRCPFSYFAADGLGIKKRRRVEFSPLESGSVIHNVLQVMVQRHGGRGLSALEDEALEGEIREIIGAYLAERIEDMDALPTRFRYLFNRLTGMLTRLLRRLGEEFSQSAFQVAAVELPISQKEGVPPLELMTPTGERILVEGVVDRVDVMEKNGKRYVRVVDYKSGVKDFKLGDVLYGLNMQMLLYLFTIGENGTGELENALPAGVLYMPVRESYVSAHRDTGADEIAKAQERQWRMNGLILDDPQVLEGMEREVAGVYIPVRMKKDGTADARSSLATPAQMGRLAGRVKELVVDMVEALAQGDIPALPALGGDYDACSYCEYRAVCGYEPGGAVREIAKMDLGEAMKKLEEEENG